jgi:hypothetical protein
LVTYIQLETGQKLNVKSSDAFPIYKSVADITKLEQRKGSYSKTFSLVGDDNNQQVLGQLFDVNVIDSTFNINKKVACDVYQDGVNVFPRAYFQLKRVIKRGDAVGQSVDYVEYTAIVYNDVVDFFKEMGNKELTDLQITNPSTFHNLSLQEIEDSYAHTWQDVYLYPRLFNNTLTYEVGDFYPAIFAKVYWDAIHAQNGFEYEWIELQEFNYQFDKLVIPFTGKYEASEEAKKNKGAELGTPQGQDPNASPIVESLPNITQPDIAIFSPNNNVIENNSGDITYLPNGLPFAPILSFFNPLTNVISDPSSNYTQPDFTADTNTVYDITFNFNYDLDLNSDGDTKFINNVSAGVPLEPLKLIIRAWVRRTRGANIEFFSVNTSGVVTIEHDEEFDNGANILSGTGFGVIAVPCESGDIIELVGFTLFIPPINNEWRIHLQGNFGDIRNITPDLSITSIYTVILPRLEYQEGIPIYLQDFIPNKIKQSDFVKSVCMMFNLLPIIDEDNPQKIIYIPRDKYYDAGREFDWSKKLARDKDFDVQFLPNVVSKALELSYKDDKDPHNEGYRGAVGKTYGQLRYFFECENTKGTERRELVFSPTPMVGTLDGAVVPAVPIVENDYNIRILYYQGVKAGAFGVLEAGNTEPTQVLNYAALSHFNNHFFPTYDLNFGVCDFYFYQGIKLTSSNLFNNHYRRLFKQLNSGKRAIGYFDLKPMDVAVLQLNDRVYINNSWWNIEEIAYNASSRQLTKVTLISIDDETSIQVTRSNESGFGRPNKPPLGDLPAGDPVIGRPYNEVGIGIDFNSNTYAGNNPWIEVHGRRNVFSQGSGGMVIGDNNKINSEKSMVIGSGITADSDGLFVDKLVVDGVDIGVGQPKQIFKALVTQTSTSAPTLIIAVDNIGFVSASYLSIGTFDLSFTTDVFDGKNVICQFTAGELQAVVSAAKRTNSMVRILSSDFSNFANGVLTNASLTIEVY